MSYTAYTSMKRADERMNAAPLEVEDEESEEKQVDEMPCSCCIKYKSLITGVILLIVIVAGVFIGVYEEGWSLLTSIYVFVQILTTVGYGDVTPNSNITRLFMSFYILFLVIFATSTLNDVGQALDEKAQNVVRNRWKEIAAHKRKGKKTAPKQSTISQLHLNNLAASIIIFMVFVLFGTIFYSTYEDCSCSYGVTLTDPNCTKANCFSANGDGTYGTKKNFVQAFYMSIVTLATVGFGDFTPLSELGRVLGCAWMFLGVITMANMVSALSLTITALQKKTTQESQDSLEILAQIDTNGKGWLSRSEFVEYMLVKHGTVKAEDIASLNVCFAAADTDKSGSVSYEEIMAYYAQDEQ